MRSSRRRVGRSTVVRRQSTLNKETRRKIRTIRSWDLGQLGTKQTRALRSAAGRLYVINATGLCFFSLLCSTVTSTMMVIPC